MTNANDKADTLETLPAYAADPELVKVQDATPPAPGFKIPAPPVAAKVAMGEALSRLKKLTTLAVAEIRATNNARRVLLSALEARRQWLKADMRRRLEANAKISRDPKTPLEADVTYFMKRIRKLWKRRNMKTHYVAAWPDGYNAEVSEQKRQQMRDEIRAMIKAVRFFRLCSYCDSDEIPADLIDNS